MPKSDIFIRPGEELPLKMTKFLNDYFSEKDFEKLSKFGGRVQISITAPSTDRKIQNSQLVIDDKFIKELKTNPRSANEKLKNLTKKQLAKVAQLLNFPITSKATTKEIKKTIDDFLNSAIRWDNISGSTITSK